MDGDGREIHTERLVLRRLGPGDLPAVVEIQGDPETSRHHPVGPASPEQAAEMLGTWLADWAREGIGYWAVSERGSDAVIGIGGLRWHELDGQPALNLYYRFRPATWGRGYATEMAAATVGWAERIVPGAPVVIVTRDDNKQSVRVAVKLGFVLTGTTAMYGGESLVFRSRGSISDRGAADG
ncbi:MAG: GNAT family N-acetyltransferase [Kutzneria sp.]|nr:GNAT family N-acetyltransferase [Kutzneria sp.]